MGRPEDIANVVRFLLSDDAEFVTGQAIVADGGVISVDSLQGSS
jgi:3-oxoacyl-[acyl-carrier protein] reductase